RSNIIGDREDTLSGSTAESSKGRLPRQMIDLICPFEDIANSSVDSSSSSSFSTTCAKAVAYKSRNLTKVINHMTFEDVRKLLDRSPNATCEAPRNQRPSPV